MEIQTFYIEGTEFTPEIKFEPEGNFMMAGVSRPEDVAKFYEKPILWLKSYKEEILDHSDNKYKFSKIHFIFKLKYFNSASAKHILKMLDILKGYENIGMEIEVDWYYDEVDEQLLEDGQDLSDAIEIPFNFIKIV